jgi:molecular chaperone DnaK (HSP70)
MENIWVPAPSERGDLVLGIDLGTSNSCMAVWHEGKSRVKIIKNIKEGE